MNSGTSVRPTRHRLLTAMGISACSIAALLALLGTLVDSVVTISKPGIEHGQPLTIRIRKGGDDPNTDSTTINQAVRSSLQEEIVSAEFAELHQKVAPVDSPERPAESPPDKLQPTTDWRTIGGETAKASVDKYFKQKESRASMWQQSRSIMFQPGSDIVLKEKEPIISDFRFKPRVYVVGLGVTIGSCFFGIPIAGVPVEQRSVAITLFVCAQDSG